jgi:hypothetical protein
MKCQFFPALEQCPSLNPIWKLAGTKIVDTWHALNYFKTPGHEIQKQGFNIFWGGLMTSVYKDGPIVPLKIEALYPYQARDDHGHILIRHVC